MESLLPSEIARLVYGYLLDEKCESAAQLFLETSEFLKECNLVHQKGRKFNTRVMGLGLVDILNLYTDAVCMFKNYKERKVLSTTELNDVIQELGNVLLVNDVDTSKTVFLRISIPPKRKSSGSLEKTVENKENEKKDDERKELEKKEEKSESSSVPESGSDSGAKNTQLSAADEFDLNMLQTLLDNTTLHERIAENINRAIDSSSEIDSPVKTDEKKIVETVLHSTEADPIFDELLHMLVAPRTSDTTTPEDTDKENGDPTENRVGTGNATQTQDQETMKRIEAENTQAVEGILAGNKKLQQAGPVNAPQPPNFILDQDNNPIPVVNVIPSSSISCVGPLLINTSTPLQPMKSSNISIVEFASPVQPITNRVLIPVKNLPAAARNAMKPGSRRLLPKAENSTSTVLHLQVQNSPASRIQVHKGSPSKGIPDIFKRSRVRTRGGLRTYSRAVKEITPQITKSDDDQINVVFAESSAGVKTRSGFRRKRGNGREAQPSREKEIVDPFNAVDINVEPEAVMIEAESLMIEAESVKNQYLEVPSIQRLFSKSLKHPQDKESGNQKLVGSLTESDHKKESTESPKEPKNEIMFNKPALPSNNNLVYSVSSSQAEQEKESTEPQSQLEQEKESTEPQSQSKQEKVSTEPQSQSEQEKIITEPQLQSEQDKECSNSELEPDCHHDLSMSSTESEHDNELTDTPLQPKEKKELMVSPTQTIPEFTESFKKSDHVVPKFSSIFDKKDLTESEKHSCLEKGNLDFEHRKEVSGLNQLGHIKDTTESCQQSVEEKDLINPPNKSEEELSKSLGQIEHKSDPGKSQTPTDQDKNLSATKKQNEHGTGRKGLLDEPDKESVEISDHQNRLLKSLSEEPTLDTKNSSETEVPSNTSGNPEDSQLQQSDNQQNLTTCEKVGSQTKDIAGASSNVSLPANEKEEGTPEQQIAVAKFKKRISLSTPRRGSHIRALDFKTPEKYELNSRKSFTSPKDYPRSQNKPGKVDNVKRGIFKSPDIKKSPEENKGLENKEIDKTKASKKSDWDADLRKFASYAPMDIPSSVGLKRKNNKGGAKKGRPKKKGGGRRKKAPAKKCTKKAKASASPLSSSHEDLVKQIEQEVRGVIGDDDFTINRGGETNNVLEMKLRAIEKMSRSHSSTSCSDTMEIDTMENDDKVNLSSSEKVQGADGNQVKPLNASSVPHDISIKQSDSNSEVSLSETKLINTPKDLVETNPFELKGSVSKENKDDEKMSEVRLEEGTNEIPEWSFATPLKLNMSPSNEDSRSQMTPTTKLLMNHLGETITSSSLSPNAKSISVLESILISEGSRLEKENASQVGKKLDLSKVVKKLDDPGEPMPKTQPLVAESVAAKKNEVNSTKKREPIKRHIPVDLVVKQSTLQTPAKYCTVNLGPPVEMTPLTKVLHNETSFLSTSLVTPTLPATPKPPRDERSPDRTDSLVELCNTSGSDNKSIFERKNTIEKTEIKVPKGAMDKSENGKVQEDSNAEEKHTVPSKGARNMANKDVKPLRNGKVRVASTPAPSRRRVSNVSKTPKVKLSPKAPSNKSVKIQEPVISSESSTSDSDIETKKAFNVKSIRDSINVKSSTPKAQKAKPTPLGLKNRKKVPKSGISPKSPKISPGKKMSPLLTDLMKKEDEVLKECLERSKKAKLLGLDFSSDSDSSDSSDDIKRKLERPAEPKVQTQTIRPELNTALERLKKLESVSMLYSSSSDDSSDGLTATPNLGFTKITEEKTLIAESKIISPTITAVSNTGPSKPIESKDDFSKKIETETKKTESIQKSDKIPSDIPVKEKDESCESFPTLYLSEESNMSMVSDSLTVKSVKFKKSPSVGNDLIRKAVNIQIPGGASAILKGVQEKHSSLENKKEVLSGNEIASDNILPTNKVNSNNETLSEKYAQSINLESLETAPHDLNSYVTKSVSDIPKDSEIKGYFDVFEAVFHRSPDKNDRMIPLISPEESAAVSKYLDNYTFSFTLDSEGSEELLSKTLRTSPFISIYDSCLKASVYSEKKKPLTSRMDKLKNTSSLRLETPRQEKQKSSLTQDKYLRQEKHKIPSRQDKHKSPPRQVKHKSPPRQEKHKSPPRQEKHKSPPRQEKHKSLSRQVKQKSPPRQEKHTSPRQEKHKSPSRAYVCKSPSPKRDRSRKRPRSDSSSSDEGRKYPRFHGRSRKDYRDRRRESHFDRRRDSFGDSRSKFHSSRTPKEKDYHNDSARYDPKRPRRINTDQYQDRSRTRSVNKHSDTPVSYSSKSGNHHSCDKRYNKNDSIVSSKSSDSDKLLVDQKIRSTELPEQLREKPSSSRLNVSERPQHSNVGAKTPLRSVLLRNDEPEEGELSDSSVIQTQRSSQEAAAEAKRKALLNLVNDESRTSLLNKVDLERFLTMLHGKEE